MSLDDYRLEIQSNIEAVNSGVITRQQFITNMEIALNREMPDAFLEGSRECGNDNIDEEAIQGVVNSEIEHLNSLAVSSEADPFLEPLFLRAELWVNRYRDVRNLGMMMSCGERHLIWELGGTEDHCVSCTRLNGHVKPASEWLASGARPQHPPNDFLVCGGWLCDCGFEATDKEATPGEIPKVELIR
jgi:hypothetical protein